jgi:hypothetical protein
MLLQPGGDVKRKKIRKSGYGIMLNGNGWAGATRMSALLKTGLKS